VVCGHGFGASIAHVADDVSDGVDGGGVEVIAVAVDEAVANAIIHGHGEKSEKNIELSLEMSDKRLAIEINDIGLFDAKKQGKKQKDIQTILKEKRKGGLGLKLIYSIMDLVTFYTKGDKSHCLMVKLLPPSPPEDQSQ